MADQSETPFYKGSSKVVYRRKHGTLDVVHLDNFSAFDVGQSTQCIPGKGKAVCASAVQSFRLASWLGIPTHFLERVDEVTIRIQEFATPEIGDMNGENFVIPVEFIGRYAFAGSLLRNLQTGAEDPAVYGFDRVPLEGEIMQWPVQQMTTKREPVDRPLCISEAMKVGGMTREELETVQLMIAHFDGAMRTAFTLAGFEYWDGKKEFAIGPKRTPVLVDSCGTPDEDRPVRRNAKGQPEHYSKELLRQWFIKQGYYDQVKKARAEGSEVPFYPELPDELVELISRRYGEFAFSYEEAVSRIVRPH